MKIESNEIYLKLKTKSFNSKYTIHNKLTAIAYMICTN